MAPERCFCPDFTGLRIGDQVPYSYIIELKSDAEFDQHKEYLSSICANETHPIAGHGPYGPEPYEYRYNHKDFKGYAGTFTETIVNKLRDRPEVAHVLLNNVTGFPERPTAQRAAPPAVPQAAHIKFDDGYDWRREEVPLSGGGVLIRKVQDPVPSWALPAISDPESNHTTTEFHHPSTAGGDVSIYIFDTGIYIGHREFQGRAVHGWNFIDDNNNAHDGEGHGTHVAGTAGGVSVGVAKRARLVAVKVLSDEGYGTDAGFILGVNWAIEHAQASTAPAVFNMSLGWQQDDPAMNAAVSRAFGAGYVCTVAAGNSNMSADAFSPARAIGAFTVGNAARNEEHDQGPHIYTRFFNSNFGNTLDIFAPGTDIPSCGIGSNEEIVDDTGTSMAAPHVAGVAATIISESIRAGTGTTTPQQIHERVKQLAKPGLLHPGTLGVGSPNLFLNNGAGVIAQ